METKKCHTCNVEKPLGEFSVAKHHRDGRQSSCKLCSKAYFKGWRNKDKEKYLIRSRKYNSKRKEKQKIWAKKYYEENKEEIKRKTREYQIRNRERVNFYASKRENKKREIRADLTLEQWEILKRIFNNRCVYCGKHTQRLEKDHIIPLSKGGAFTLHNIVPACRSCNAKKNVNLPEIPIKILLF